MPAVTHTRVREEVVDPAMDALSLNDWQALAIYNPSPEVDSALERVDLLASYGVPCDLIEALRDDLWLAVELNGREHQCERQVAGNGEKLVRDLRPANGGVSLKPRNVARLLRPVLDVLVSEHPDPMAFVHASRDLREIERQVPRETLLCRSLEGEIGKLKFAKLRDLLGEEAA